MLQFVIGMFVNMGIGFLGPLSVGIGLHWWLMELTTADRKLLPYLNVAAAFGFFVSYCFYVPARNPNFFLIGTFKLIGAALAVCALYFYHFRWDKKQDVERP